MYHIFFCMVEESSKNSNTNRYTQMIKKLKYNLLHTRVSDSLVSALDL